MCHSWIELTQVACEAISKLFLRKSSRLTLAKLKKIAVQPLSKKKNVASSKSPYVMYLYQIKL